VALVEKLELRDRERDELHARLKECVDESARLETALAEARETSRRATADLRQLDLALRSKWTLAKMLFGGGRAAP
jgi:septal ring factor EnvC (AmiA/AmiB activator)